MQTQQADEAGSLRQQLDSCQAEAERLSQVVQDSKQTEESLLSRINAVQETNSQQQVTACQK